MESSARRTAGRSSESYAPPMGCGVLELLRRRVPGRAAGVFDAVVAGALLAGTIWTVPTLPHDRSVTITVLGAALSTTSVGWRRLAPVPAALVALVGVLLYQLAGHDTQGAFTSIALVLSSYLVGRASVPWTQRVLVSAFALAVIVWIQIDSGFSLGNVVATWLPLVIAPAAVGWFVHERSATVDELREVRERLRDELELARSRAVTDERMRVARELHDAVAHCVSVMVIQAGAARLVARNDPAAAKEALRTVAASGREALADMRRMVGVRRRTEDEPSPPRPGLDELASLADRARRSGTEVTLQLEVSTTVREDMDLAIYRIVQEGLTNAVKHAPNAVVRVCVHVRPELVEIAIEDSGPASPSPARGSGHGLVGMRERALLHGGDLEAGPTATGGFAVIARWPTNPAAARLLPASEHASDSVAGRFGLTPHVIDGLTSGAWLVALEVEALTSSHRGGPLAPTAAGVAAMAAAGLIRRGRPLLFVAIVGALAIALSGGVGAPQRSSVVGAYTVLMCSYAVAAYCPRPRAVLGLIAFLGGLIAVNVLHHTPVSSAVGGALMSIAVWIAGRVVRAERTRAEQLRAANAALAAERDARAELALREEQLRIAEDLQVIAAGDVSAMVVQAVTTEQLLDLDPSAATGAIATIEDLGRETLNHLRRMLGVLRSGDDPAPRRPQQGKVAPYRDPAPVA